MMGRKRREFAPLCNTTLDELVPTDNFYRRLDHVVDLGFVRELVGETYKRRGRPSIDPIVFCKLMLVKRLEGLRSERELVRTAADRLSLRWYLGYDLDESLPDHSSISRIRARYGDTLLDRFFQTVQRQLRTEGLSLGRDLTSRNPRATRRRRFRATQKPAGVLTTRGRERQREEQHPRRRRGDQSLRPSA